MIVSTLLGKSEKYDVLVEKFVDQLPNLISEVSTAFQENNFEQLKQEVHRLKGVGGNYGFQILTDTCASIEKDLESQSLEKIRDHLKLLENIIIEIQEGMLHYKNA